MNVERESKPQRRARLPVRMMILRRPLRRLACAVALVTATLACSASRDASSGDPDGGASRPEASTSDPPIANADAAGGSDAAVLDVKDGAGACGSLGQSAPVPLREQVASIPTPTGGAIVDGLYHLVREASLSGGGFDELNHVTVRIKAGTMELNEQRVGKTSQIRATYLLTQSGTNLTRTMTCRSDGAPADDAKTSGYTAAPTKLTLFYDPKQLAEFELQP